MTPGPQRIPSDAELDELLGAYALDAVDDDERLIVEAYLVRSPRARAEVNAHLQVAAALGNLGGEAPSTVWAGIDAIVSGRTVSEDHPVGAPGSHDVAVALTPVVALAGRRRQRVALASGWLAAAAAVVGLVVVSDHSSQRRSEVASDLDRARLELDERDREVARLLSRADDAARVADDRLAERVAAETTTERLRAELARFRSGPEARAELLLADPTVERTLLADEGGRERATVVIDRTGEGYVIASNLPRLPAGQTYQLWGVHGDRVLSVGVLGPEVRVVGFAAAPAPDGQPFDRFVLTAEQGAGVVTSAGPAVAAGVIA